MRVQSDEQLVRACAEGDSAAWNRLVGLYSGWIERVARASFRRLRGSAPEADVEDARSEVFRQLLERDRALLRSLRPPYHLRAWLGIIARRTCGKIADRRRENPASVQPEAPEPGASFAESLSRLPAADRLLLELYFAQDCPYREIASILGISVESVGKQKTRALEKLRKILEPDPGP